MLTTKQSSSAVPSSSAQQIKIDMRELRVIESKRTRATFCTRKRRCIAIAVVSACGIGVLLTAAIIVAIATVVRDTTEVTIKYKLTSVYYGNQGWSMGDVENLSSWVGKRPTVLVLYTDWCIYSMSNLFNIQLNNIWNNQSIPLITWELFGCGGNSQPGIINLVNNNSYDSYINQWADQLKIWLAGNDGIFGNSDDRRAYLRPAHEMNGNWYPWSLISTPVDYIAAWRHIHDIFSNKSLDWTRLQWIWYVNTADVGSYTAENYWVGDDYVDWLGVDGYNFGGSQSWSTWLWPNQIFGNMIGRLRNLSSTKPLSINEYGTSSILPGNISDIPSKVKWLDQFCDYMNTNDIKIAPYFNQDKETDWAIFNGIRGDTVWNNFNAYTDYKNCLQTDDWLTSDSTNPRLITDEQFAGRTTTTIITSSANQIISALTRNESAMITWIYFLLIIHTRNRMLSTAAL